LKGSAKSERRRQIKSKSDEVGLYEGMKMVLERTRDGEKRLLFFLLLRPISPFLFCFSLFSIWAWDEINLALEGFGNFHSLFGDDSRKGISLPISEVRRSAYLRREIR